MKKSGLIIDINTALADFSIASSKVVNKRFALIEAIDKFTNGQNGIIQVQQAFDDFTECYEWAKGYKDEADKYMAKLVEYDFNEWADSVVESITI